MPAPHLGQAAGQKRDSGSARAPATVPGHQQGRGGSPRDRREFHGRRGRGVGCDVEQGGADDRGMRCFLLLAEEVHADAAPQNSRSPHRHPLLLQLVEAFQLEVGRRSGKHRFASAAVVGRGSKSVSILASEHHSEVTKTSFDFLVQTVRPYILPASDLWLNTNKSVCRVNFYMKGYFKRYNFQKD